MALRTPESVRAQVRAAKAEDPSLSLRALGRRFGLHNTNILSILSEEAVLTASRVRQPEPDPEPIIEEEPEGNWQYGPNWTFNADTQAYIFFLKCRPKPLVLGAEKLRSMKRAYSNWDGQPATINEICRRFSIPRDQFTELKATLGWSHDQEPFLAEDVLARPVEDLADDALQQKRQNLYEEFQKKEWQQIKKAAENWERLEQTFIQPLREHIQTHAHAWVPLPFNIKRPARPFAVVTNTGELHYGKAGWAGETGEEYNRDIAVSRLRAARQDMLQEVAERGKPDTIICAVGNDFFHIDNENNATSKNTLQDCDGTVSRIFHEGLALAVEDLGMLLSVAPVEIAYVRGNHEGILSYAMLEALAGRFHDAKNLTIKLKAEPRYYTTYGNTLLGFAHGDGALKPKDFMGTMMKEATHLISQTRFRAFYTGHLHSEVVRELTGGTHYQMRSLSGPDRFHVRNGYLSEAGLNTYLLDREFGTRAALTWTPPSLLLNGVN